MGLQIFKWLFPIVIELFKGNQRFRTYTKRNMGIVLLGIAGLVSMLLNFYLFEQASAYGALYKDAHTQVTTANEKLAKCERDVKHLNETKFVCPEPSGQINNE